MEINWWFVHLHGPINLKQLEKSLVKSGINPMTRESILFLFVLFGAIAVWTIIYEININHCNYTLKEIGIPFLTKTPTEIKPTSVFFTNILATNIINTN